MDAGERQALGSVRTGLSDCANLFRQYLVHARRKEFTQAHDILSEKMLPAMGALSKASAALAGHQRAALEVVVAASRGEVGTSRWIALGLSAVGLLAAAAVLAMLRRSFAGLRGIAARLEQESQQVARASRQVAASSEAMAKGASNQAATLEHTAAAGREVQATAQSNLQSAQSTAAATEEVVRSVAEANLLVDEMSAAMQEMSDSSDRISRIILKTAAETPPDEPSSSAASACSNGLYHPSGEVRSS